MSETWQNAGSDRCRELRGFRDWIPICRQSDFRSVRHDSEIGVPDQTVAPTFLRICQIGATRGCCLFVSGLSLKPIQSTGSSADHAELRPNCGMGFSLAGNAVNPGRNHILSQIHRRSRRARFGAGRTFCMQGLFRCWCPRRDSNSHSFRKRFLKPPRLPFHHSGAGRGLTPLQEPGKTPPAAATDHRSFVPKVSQDWMSPV
jgi:hypothetical protein